jgi:hypothetical protein
MKYCFVLVWSCIVLNINAQPSFDAFVNTGFNRIGFLYDLGGQLEMKSHQIRLGLRFYAPDQVFESNRPGLQLAYRFQYPGFKKFNLLSGLQISYFQEYKGEIRFRLIDPNAELGGQWRISKSIRIATIFSIGSTQIYTNGGILQGTEHFNYLNYEFKIGLTYRFIGADL